MKSYKLIRNINYNVINYILNFICIFNNQCYCSYIDHKVLGSNPFKSSKNFFQNLLLKMKVLILELDSDIENHAS